MHLLAAAAFAALLCGASMGLLAWADEATDLAAIAGGLGLVMAGALLGLTFLAWRWRADSSGRYVATPVADHAFYDDLASSFDDAIDGADGSQQPLRAAT